MSTYEPEEQFISEDELKSLLDRWVTPKPSKALDQRVANSYYTELETADAVARSTPFPLSQKEVVAMKFCSTCREEFADKFSFCPVDGTPLNAVVAQPQPPVTPKIEFTEPIVASAPAVAAVSATAAAAYVPRGEYHLTFMDDAGLTSRLVESVKEVAHQSELTWPEFKRDPFGFTKRGVVGYGQASWRFLSQPNVATGVLASLFIMITAIFAIVWLDRVQTQQALQQRQEEALIVENFLDIPAEQPTPDEGTAGLNKGDGGGSKPKKEKPGGGGGGGREDPKPASFGKTPQASLTVPQVVAPDPKPPVIKNPSLPVAATVVADPLLVPPDARVLPYGDFKSKSTDPSSGPGVGNGIGTGKGGGIGPG
ncbi:MAG TPA: hypothetical protein VJV03_17160, partial [Pyrinomonadaceae bacterium]|nr:hypothetical protein [Pyrinomonadaceae bacterium]